MNQSEIQEIAINNWKRNGKRGTIEAVTGIGKTFIGLHAIRSYPAGCSVVFLAETTLREIDVLADIAKFKEIYNFDVLSHCKFEFACYQSAYKWNSRYFDLVIADEIHDSLTPEYFKFYENNTFNGIVGLSATIDVNTSYDGVTKGEMLNRIAPICYTYGLDDSIRNKTSRKLNVYIVNHRLEAVSRDMVAGTKTKPFKTTEEKNYVYWEKEYLKATSLDLPECFNLEDYRIAEKNKEMTILRSSNKRAKCLYELPSKIKTTTRLLDAITGKTIVFSNSIDSLLRITNDVVSSKNTKERNTLLRKQFDEDVIKTIGSFKMLKQGANLLGARNIIVMSYYSKEKDIIQRVGRLRKDGEDIGNVFIFRTNHTQEEIWYERMMENISEFNIIECDDISNCIFKYLENENNSRRS